MRECVAPAPGASPLTAPSSKTIPSFSVSSLLHLPSRCSSWSFIFSTGETQGLYSRDTCASFVPSSGLVELAGRAPDWKSDQFLVLNVAARTFLDHPTIKEVEGGGVLGGSSGQGPGLTETQVPPRTLGPILAVTPAPGIHELLPGCSDSLRAPPAKDSHSSGVQSHRTEPQLQVSPGELTVPREDLAKPQA